MNAKCRFPKAFFVLVIDLNAKKTQGKKTLQIEIVEIFCAINEKIVV
jgi:hypothetical protein